VRYPELSVREACRLLGVNRSWYYARGVHDSAEGEDERLVRRIEALVLEFPGYGYRRIGAALRREGIVVNAKRIRRLMRENGLLCRVKRRFVLTTNSEHSLKVYPNLIKGYVPKRTDEVWVADITYVRFRREFCYLAVLLDACSRKCVGFQVGHRVDEHLVVGALKMALTEREVRPGLIHHSDRGVQYAAKGYTQMLKQAGIRISMASRGNPYENAIAESFFKTLKCEEVYLKDYRTIAEAKENIVEFIDKVYNQKRLHSSLGYVSPTEFETLHYTPLPTQLVVW